jgi:hypothetical protein
MWWPMWWPGSTTIAEQSISSSNRLLNNYYPAPSTKFLVSIAYSLATVALKFDNM